MGRWINNRMQDQVRQSGMEVGRLCVGGKKLWKLLFLEWVTPANKSNIKPEEGVE